MSSSKRNILSLDDDFDKRLQRPTTATGSNRLTAPLASGTRNPLDKVILLLQVKTEYNF
jgi:hypothetical protein